MPVTDKHTSTQAAVQTETYEEKVQQIADRIWKLWQQELRDERERRGKGRK